MSRLTVLRYCGLVHGSFSIYECVTGNRSFKLRTRNQLALQGDKAGVIGSLKTDRNSPDVSNGQSLQTNKKSNESEGQMKGQRSSRTCKKKILLWANTHKSKNLQKFDNKLVGCKDINCYIRLAVGMNWHDLEDSHAVIFDHKFYKDWKSLIRRRPPNQIWIFYTRESPAHSSEKNNFPEGISGNVHNWTKVYLSDSDIPTFYGRFVYDREKALQDRNVNWAANKNKLCAWVASNCKYTSWKRLDFVARLQEYLPIDTYGRCGITECPGDCREFLKSYKFYLALESHTCREYITEKVWRNSFEENVVPIVYGAPKEDYEKVLPPHSFIHVEDFKSFKELADFLLYLDKNNEKYNEYFRWKNLGVIYRETGSTILTNPSLCVIGRKLVEVDTGKPAVKKQNIKEWWEGSCFTVKNPLVFS